MKQHGFVLPGFLLSPTGIMGVLIVALSVSNFLLYNFWQGAKRDFILYEAQVQAASATADAQNSEKLRMAEKTTGEVARIYGDHIAALESGFNSRLERMRRERDGNRETMSRTAETTKGVNGGATGCGLDSAYIAACDRIEKDLVGDALQLMHLQVWVKKVCR